MRTITLFTAFLLCLMVGIFVLLNISNIITLENNFFQLRVNVGFLILFAALAGSIIMLLLGLGLGSSKKSKELKRKIEDEKLNKEIESDKIKQLEAKVKTLEEALNMATKAN